MILVRAVAAELRKTVTLPAARVAVAIAVLGSLGITMLNAFNVRGTIQNGQLESVAFTSPVEAVFSAIPLGTVGAVILGVVAISSEYTANTPDAGGGRQTTATLTATPRRVAVLAAKVVTVVLLTAATTTVTITACLALAHLIVGDAGTTLDGADTLGRGFGTAIYWTLTGLIALAITVLTRNGIIPLIVLIANSSLMSVSLLLTNLTPLAYWLPDVAGMRLFASDPLGLFEDALDPLTGGLVMTAWALGLLTVSGVVFARRDA